MERTGSKEEGEVKRMRRITAVLMAVMMVFFLSIASFAEDYSADPTIYTEGYHVMLNGEYVVFTDAKPVNKQGRIMVPFRAILEALGAKVDWTDETRPVTAKTDDTFISFRVGQPNIDVTKNGEKSVKVMDVVPYIDPSNDRTYVSTRFVSEALGFTVGWDAEDQTAVIIDYETLFGDADKIFTKMDGFLKSAGLKEGVTREMTLDVGIRTEAEGEEMATGVSGKLVQRDLEGSANLTQTMDMAAFVESIFAGTGEGLTEEDRAVMAEVDEIGMDLVLDMDTGDMYMKTSASDLLFGEEYADAWIRMDLREMYGGMGVDIPEMTRQSLDGMLTIKGQLMKMGEATAENMSVGTYDEMLRQYKILKAMLSDPVLEVTTSKGVKEYRAAISEAAAADPGISGTVVLTDDGKGGCTCRIDVTMELPELDARTAYSIYIITERIASAPAALPDGAQVVDLSELVEEL